MADFLHVPTEGMQRDDIRRVMKAAERLQAALEERDAHSAGLNAAFRASVEEGQRWLVEREHLTGQLCGAVQGLLTCVRWARESGALPAVDTEREAMLRDDYADRAVAP